MRTVFGLGMLLISAGCAHRGFHTRTAAEVAFVTRYADAMGNGCREAFVFERDPVGGVILTSRGIQETDIRVEACGQTVVTRLDCDMPWHHLGWQCDAHTLPTPARMYARSELASELRLLFGAIEDAGCSARGRVRVERTQYNLVGTQPSVLRSRWMATACGRSWTAESRCVKAGLYVDGEGPCRMVAFEAASPAPAAVAPVVPPAPAEPAPTPARTPAADTPAPASASASAAGSAPAPAPAETGALRVRVKDAEGFALEGVTVALRVGMREQTRITGATGDLTFPDLPPGEYTFTFARKGFDGGSRAGITVVGGRTSVVDVALHRTPPTQSCRSEARAAPQPRHADHQRIAPRVQHGTRTARSPGQPARSPPHRRATRPPPPPYGRSGTRRCRR